MSLTNCFIFGRLLLLLSLLIWDYILILKYRKDILLKFAFPQRVIERQVFVFETCDEVFGDIVVVVG